MSGAAATATTTVLVSNIPPTAVAADLLSFFDSALSSGSAFACEIFSSHRGWLSHGKARLQFYYTAAAALAVHLSASGLLPLFRGARLSVSPSHDDIIDRAGDEKCRLVGVKLFAGNRIAEREVEVLEEWDEVRVEVMPQRRRVDFYLEVEEKSYKLEVLFEDIRETFGCTFNGNAILLQVNTCVESFDISRS